MGPRRWYSKPWWRAYDTGYSSGAVIRSVLLLLLLGGLPKTGGDAPPLPPPRIALRLEAPDVAGPWKMVVTNDGDVPVRVAADGRLLSLEIERPEEGGPEDPYGKAGARKKPPPPVVCRLPSELRPSGVTEDRAVVLGPGTRYEEVVSPALYCFTESEAKALIVGARVTAKLGFPDGTKGAPKTAPRAPFVAEPAVVSPPVGAAKEIVSESFVVAAPAPASSLATASSESSDDPRGPRLELTARARVDSIDEKTVATTLTLKNLGGRDVRLHVRRDNLLFDVDGPDGSTHCGLPVTRRAVPRDLVESLAAGASRSIEVWIGEMCSNVAFDRPGLYRIRIGLAFPAPPAADGQRPWTQTVVTREPLLVRIRQGRLPFYTSPPQVFGGDGGARGGG